MNLSSRDFEADTAHHEIGMDWMLRVSEVNQLGVKAHEALLVGAAEQGSLGDILMPHVLTRLLSLSRFRCAGLVGSDETSRGAYAVRNYGEAILEMAGSRNLQLIHVGGETLATGLVEGYQAAAKDEEAERFESLAGIAGEDELKRFVKRRSGQLDEFAYVLAPEGEFYGAGLSFHAVGLSDPESLSESRKRRLLNVLRAARFVGVRDDIGARFLEEAGIEVHRMPCGLSVLPQVCARQLREYRDSEELERVRRRFPDGWVAVDVSGADAHFDRLVAALREVSEKKELGLVFFQSETAHGGGSSGALRRWIEAFPEWNATGFRSAHVWETASMLLHSRLYCGSSLGARTICMSGGVARINIPSGRSDVASYCELWEHDDVPIEFSLDENWEAAFDEALAVDLSMLQAHATWLHREYFDALEHFCRSSGMAQCLTAGKGEPGEARPTSEVHHLQDEWLGSNTVEEGFPSARIALSHRKPSRHDIRGMFRLGRRQARVR